MIFFTFNSDMKAVFILLLSLISLKIVTKNSKDITFYLSILINSMNFLNTKE